jgi:predicted amidohydrolase YtcJ
MKLNTAMLWWCAISMTLAQENRTLQKADAIYVDGNIYTGVTVPGPFPAIKRVQAMAIRGDRIAGVGTEAEMLQLKGPETRVIDLGGNFVMPGFNDGHLHLAEAGFRQFSVDLTGVKSLTEFRQRIRARVGTADSGEWILGGGWDQTLWPVKELPTRWDIDEVSTDHPVFLERVDGHIAVANTRALQRASISIASKDPEGGKIDRDPTGQPTGVLRETARQAIQNVIPPPTHDKRRQAIEAALRDLAHWGVTSVQDYSGWNDFQIYQELEREGRLTVRISEWLPFSDSLETLQAHRSAHSSADNLLRTTMLKGFMDGSLGSRTAALIQPYSDDPNNSGLPQFEQPQLNEMTKERLDAGFQIGFHAIGDRAVQMALDAFAAAESDARDKKIKGAHGEDDYRLRIEHAQVTTPQQILKFKQLKVIASIQPNHLLTDMNWAQSRLGPKRAASSYAWAEFLKNGVMLAFGTDYPVEPVTPFRGLYAAVTRQSEDGKKQYYPDEKLTIEQAISAYTTGSAFAEFSENTKGRLAPAMLADFVVLDRDITSVPPANILGTRVFRTVVGGKTVYESK